MSFLDELGVAAHRGPHDLVDAVEPADVVDVSVGDEDGGDLGLAEVAVGVEDQARPLAVLLAGVDEGHLRGGVADEVDIRPAGVEGVGVLDVQPVNVLADTFQGGHRVLREAAVAAGESYRESRAALPALSQSLPPEIFA